MIFTCHDHQFVSTVAGRVIELRADGTMADYNMGYEEYLAKKSEE